MAQLFGSYFASAPDKIFFFSDMVVGQQELKVDCIFFFDIFIFRQGINVYNVTYV